MNFKVIDFLIKFVFVGKKCYICTENAFSPYIYIYIYMFFIFNNLGNCNNFPFDLQWIVC